MDDKNSSSFYIEKIGELSDQVSYLFFSDSDSDLSSIIDLFAKRFLVLPEDIISISSADSKGKSDIISIELIRGLIRKVQLTPIGPKRLAIIRDCEKMNQEAGNSFLKILEETPENTIFLLFAGNLNILPTIKSRARVINLFRGGSTAKDYQEIVELLNFPFYKQSQEVDKIIKENRVEWLFDGLREIFEKKLQSEKDKESVRALKLILATEKNIKKNANARLAIENMLLQISQLSC